MTTDIETRQGQATFREIAAGVVALALLAFIAFRWGMEGIVHNRAIQVVPDLNGKSIGGALDMLSPLGLAITKEGTEFNNAVPIGSILRQRPPAGTKVREGKIVRVVISQGGETVFTPSLAGLPLRNAEMMLRQNQLVLGEVTEAYSLKLEKGLVLSQDPRSESSVERNSIVNVVVSAGAPPEGIVLMPDFSRKNVAEAAQWAQSVGASLTVAKDPASLFPNGTVIAQQPAADSVVAAGAPVQVTISARAGGQEASLSNFHYQVPQGSSESLVRILLVDQHGERELFNGLRAPGSRIELTVPEAEQARVKIFLNGILVEERRL